MKRSSAGRAPAKKSKALAAIENFYARTLPIFLKNRKKGLMVVLVLFILSLFLFALVDKELMPRADQGQFSVKIGMPMGVRVEVTNEVAQRIENHILGYEEVESINSIVGSNKGKGGKDVLERLGPNEAQISVNLKPKRKIPTERFMQKLKDDAGDIDVGRARVEYILESSIIQAESGGQGAGPITIEVKGEDLSVLKNLTLKLQHRMGSVKGLYDIKNNIVEPSPETKIHILKDKASLYGLSVFDIAQTSQTAVKGRIATKYKEAGDEIDVRVQLREEDRGDYSMIRNIMIHSQLGMDVPLAEVAYFVRGIGPTQIDRMEQERTALVSSNVYKRAMKDVTADINVLIKSIDAPSGYEVKLTGETEEMGESFASLRFALILSVLLVYMIMASQFESIIQPFIIMFTVPLSIIGVVWALILTHTSLNVVVLLGVIMLGGIVVNNGIVLVDYINILRAQGVSIEEAVVKAGKARLRPILMTALTTILGLFPMALALGRGSELRSPLAISVMGGLLVSTFLTIFIIPAIYLVIEDISSRAGSKK